MVSGILVAGVGNVFLGDDGFGVEVVQRLSRRRPLPQDVRVVDFGVSGIDLTFALLDGVDAAILVDSVQRGEPPGSLYVIEPEPEPDVESDPSDMQPVFLSPHQMDLGKVLRLVRMLGSECQNIVLVGCEAVSFGIDPEGQGRMGLSDPVAASVDKAVELIEMLIEQMQKRLAAESEARLWGGDPGPRRRFR